MAARLMLSLKEAATKPSVPWSLSTMSQPGGGTMQEHETVRFPSRTSNGLRGVLGAPALLDTVDIELELEPTPRLPRNFPLPRPRG